MSDPRDLHVIAAIESEETLRKMQTALLAAAEQFEKYVDYHLAKTPADREKAAINLEWAARCREAARQEVGRDVYSGTPWRPRPRGL